MKKLWRILRSRRLAVWAIIAFAGYSAIATVVSQDDFAAPYRHPIFFVIATLLAASTTACAWERTRTAVSNARIASISERAREQLLQRPTFVVRSGDSGLDEAEIALRRLRMRTWRQGDVLVGRGGIGGALGSPLFHWSLALLFVVVALGQMTRAEGLMGVVQGTEKPDLPESYGKLETGPLVGQLSGYRIAVPQIVPDYTVGGIDRGPTPLVEIRTPDGSVLATGYAYANHPIRYGSMLVHENETGLAVVATIKQGEDAITEQVLLDYVEDRSQVEANGFTLHDPAGQPIFSILFDLPAQRVAEDRPSARVRIGRGILAAEGADATELVLAEGDTAEVGDGITLTVDRLTTYARLSVVDDWSVYPIYALFLSAITGLSLAIFTPLRAVRLLLTGDSEERLLHVALRHGRGDPNFPASVESALRSSMEGVEQ